MTPFSSEMQPSGTSTEYPRGRTARVEELRGAGGDGVPDGLRGAYAPDARGLRGRGLRRPTLPTLWWRRNR